MRIRKQSLTALMIVALLGATGLTRAQQVESPSVETTADQARSQEVREQPTTAEARRNGSGLRLALTPRKTYVGFGRYIMRVNLDVARINGTDYRVTRRGSELVLGGHTLYRGIYRKSRPWLYIHEITDTEVDVTFDEGTWPDFPVSTAISATILRPYDHDWVIGGTTNVAFPCDYSLVSNRWSPSGVLLDLNQFVDDRWLPVDPEDDEFFLRGDGSQSLGIQQTGTVLTVREFDYGSRMALVRIDYDQPSSPCFVDGGAWNPSGRWIQDVALDTLGTRDSCVPAGGKPFYQMRLGATSKPIADEWGEIIKVNDTLTCLLTREAWCSEAISYWHRQTGIPYSQGYRNGDWLLDWQLTNTRAIEAFYKTEEALADGRGNWVAWSDLDYGDFRPGENAPAPGSYVLIRRLGSSGWDGRSHSMMINSMTIYRMPSGDVGKVEASIVEGNSGGRVKDSRVIDDIWSVTPAGPDDLGSSRKIRGFGVDLDAQRQPIIDRARLFDTPASVSFYADINHIGERFRRTAGDSIRDLRRIGFDRSISSIEVQGNYIIELFDRTNFRGQRLGLVGQDDVRDLRSLDWNDRARSLRLRAAPAPRRARAADPLPDPNQPRDLVASLVAYAKRVKEPAAIRSNAEKALPQRIPDGRTRWTLSRLQTDAAPLEITIDLHAVHPVPIKAVLLYWDKQHVPTEYRLEWAGAERDFVKSPGPRFHAPKTEKPRRGLTPVAIPLRDDRSGVKVRYLKLVFPVKALSADAVLDTVRILHDWGPDTDDPRVDAR